MSTKKLTLDKETLRQMTDGQTLEAGGGYIRSILFTTSRLSLSIRTTSIWTSSISETSYESSILPY